MKYKKFAWIIPVFICLAVLVAVICISCSKQTPQNENIEFQPEPEPSEAVAFPQDNREEWVVLELDSTWVGYKNLPFDEYLKKGIPAVYKDSSEVKKCAVIAHEGWNAEGLLDESTLPEGSKAVTYVADTVMVLNGEDTVVGFKFYMELTPENVLKAVAFERYEAFQGWGDVCQEEETNQLLEELKEYM